MRCVPEGIDFELIVAFSLKETRTMHCILDFALPLPKILQKITKSTKCPKIIEFKGIYGIVNTYEIVFTLYVNTYYIGIHATRELKLKF